MKIEFIKIKLLKQLHTTPQKCSKQHLSIEGVFSYGLALLLLLIGQTPLSAQDCNVGNVSYCYGNNENTVITYCPDDPVTQKIVVQVNDFAFEPSVDGLTIYDGTGTAGTILGQVSGTGNSGFSYIATPQSEGGDGCITMNIISNASSSCNTGQFGSTDWDVFCQIQCTPPTAVIVADVTEICSTEADNQAVGVTVNFDASTSTHGNGTSFTSYEWHFGDGTIETTATPTNSHTYTAAGGYTSFVVVTDDLGCNSTNLADQLIQVSGAPTFSTSSDAPAGGVCQGSSFNLMGSHVNYTWNEEIQQPTVPPTPLPDGTGATFSSPVFFTQFGNGDAIENGANLTVMINMEHSYMGDLLMELVCPGGGRVTLLDFPNNMANTNTGGGTTSGGAAGPGEDYIFSMSAATLFNTNTFSADQNLPSGTYLPDGDFADLNGCPLNGEWRIEITDNFNQDDGTLFSWELTLSGIDENKRFLESFTNTYPTAVWTGDGVTGTTATPTTSGTQTYTYTVTDNFGCEYSESLDVTVLSSADPSCNAAPVIVSSNLFSTPENTTPVIDVQSTDDSDSEGLGNGLTYSFTGNGADDLLFTIDSDDGEIRFNTTPDYENSNDTGGDRQYDIEVQVCDSENACTTQMIAILVTDVDEDNDGYIGIAEPDDSDPCNPDPQEAACQQNCNGQSPVISGN